MCVVTANRTTPFVNGTELSTSPQETGWQARSRGLVSALAKPAKFHPHALRSLERAHDNLRAELFQRLGAL